MILLTYLDWVGLSQPGSRSIHQGKNPEKQQAYSLLLILSTLLDGADQALGVMQNKKKTWKWKNVYDLCTFSIKYTNSSLFTISAQKYANLN